jgi:hypothetical protein
MKAQVKYDKPLPIGVTILELSKLHMQRYYYEILKPYYGDRMKFLYTDSFFLELQTESFKKDLEDPRLKPYFETKETEGNLGIMKIEKEGIVEFKAYYPKHYYYIFKTPTGYDFSEAFKGIPKLARLVMDTQGIEEHLKKGQVRELSISEFTSLYITSKNHEIVLKDTVKKVTDTDDKRHYISKTAQLVQRCNRVKSRIDLTRFHHSPWGGGIGRSLGDVTMSYQTRMRLGGFWGGTREILGKVAFKVWGSARSSS